MGLSSNTLVHLTINKDSLIGILKEGFQLKYCSEDVTLKGPRLTGAFPMVCFSDIPLSEIKNQIKSYGNYGIGLKKDWAKKNGLNPVLYLDQTSSLGEIISNDFNELWDLVNKKKLEHKFFDNLVHITSYVKNYEGKLKTNKIEIENYRFSDEREWRYVPNKKELVSNKTFINNNDYNTAAKKKKANDELKKIKLKFTPDDINYIFVENESEISEFMNLIRKSNSQSSFESVERLTSRIMTTEQIKTDI